MAADADDGDAFERYMSRRSVPARHRKPRGPLFAAAPGPGVQGAV